MADRIPLIVNSTASQIQELPTTDALLIHSGAGKGLEFTNNPGGGTGDVATITYEVVSGEQTNFKIAVTNDGTPSNIDNIELSTPNGASVNVTANTAATNKTTGALVVTGGVGISGALHVGVDITAFATSDRSYKDNLTPITNALDKVGILTGYTFTWNSKSLYNGQAGVGVVAQEVEALGMAGITTTRNDGKKGVRYDRLTAILIEAVKELKKENDDLKTLIKNSSSFVNLKSSL